MSIIFLKNWSLGVKRFFKFTHIDKLIHSGRVWRISLLAVRHLLVWLQHRLAVLLHGWHAQFFSSIMTWGKPFYCRAVNTKAPQLLVGGLLFFPGISMTSMWVSAVIPTTGGSKTLGDGCSTSLMVLHICTRAPQPYGAKHSRIKSACHLRPPVSQCHQLLRQVLFCQRRLCSWRGFISVIYLSPAHRRDPKNAFQPDTIKIHVRSHWIVHLARGYPDPSRPSNLSVPP